MTIFAKPIDSDIAPFPISLQDDPDMIAYGYIIKGPDRSYRPEEIEFYQHIDGNLIVISKQHETV